MKRITSYLLTIAMLVAVSAFFTSCQEDAPEINYTMNVSVVNDFSKVVEAINNGALKNEEAIKKLADAIDMMNSDQAGKLQAIIDVLNSMNATIDTKLAAIEAAMKAQTLSLEGKLSLLETAVKNQTIKQEEMGAKLATAIDNLKGSLAEKLDAVKAIIESTSKTNAEKLAAIEAAIRAQTLSLEGKLQALEAAIKAMPDYSDKLEAIKTVIESFNKSNAERLTAIENAMKAQTLSLTEKLVLIEAALKAQTLSLEDKLQALEAAIKALPDYSMQLQAIEVAIKALPDYSDKLSAIEVAIKALPDYSDKFDAVVAALNAMKTEIEALGTAQGNIATQIANTITAINNLIAAVNNGNTNAADALAQIIQKLEELKKAIGSGSTPPAGPSMTLTTAKAVGETIELSINADAADQADVWVDLNNNGAKDAGEEVTEFDQTLAYTLGAQTVTIYGKVTKLNCRHNQLQALDITKNTQLTWLDCCYNQLQALDVTKNTQLTWLYCGSNQFQALDVTKNTQLKDLWCFENQLQALDVTKNTQLTLLECYDNQLATLDVSKNTALTRLQCFWNKLATLDVSKNTALTMLRCNNNQLTTLNVSKNKELEWLICYNNKISGDNMTALVNSLPDRNGKEEGKFWVIAVNPDTEQNVITAAQAAVATDRNWPLRDSGDNPYTPPGDIPNPLSLVAEYNVNPAGDGFVTSLTDCTESGYFTFDDAVAQFTNITIGGKQYHLPSIEEWRSIVPQNMMHVHFTNTESHDDISETVTVQGTSITMTSDFRTGVSGVSYALRYKGTDMVSAWRYEYIENGDNTHMKVTSRSLKGQTGVTVEDIAKPAFWNANGDNDVTRHFPASGYFYSGSLGNVDTYGYFWSSSQDSSILSWNMFFYSRYAHSYYNDSRYVGLSVRLFSSGD